MSRRMTGGNQSTFNVAQLSQIRSSTRNVNLGYNNIPGTYQAPSKLKFDVNESFANIMTQGKNIVSDLRYHTNDFSGEE